MGAANWPAGDTNVTLGLDVLPWIDRVYPNVLKVLHVTCGEGGLVCTADGGDLSVEPVDRPP